MRGNSIDILKKKQDSTQPQKRSQEPREITHDLRF